MAESQDRSYLFDEEGWPEDHRSGFVAVIGKPNVGKSTLMNAYLGQKVAIVSDKPQTTRRRLLGILTRPDAQVIFVDTPGIHRPRHKLGQFMVQTATRAIPDADEILFVVDVSTMPGDEDRQIAALIAEHEHVPVILALNKMDLLPPHKVQPHINAYLDLVRHDDWMMTSATRGDNLNDLLERIVAHLPVGPRYYPEEQITDQTVRAIAAELIREQVLRFTHQEVPHAVAVLVDEFKERSADMTYIHATIVVERNSQKRILLGEKGQMIRRISTAARREIERLVGTRVYLELWVKVWKKWRKDEANLRRLGYALPKRSR
ncbi:MAG TPA: GTPase Era [Anaerolineae bacterium]|nr:GTPase Era [Anaerolineae bacterium]